MKKNEKSDVRMHHAVLHKILNRSLNCRNKIIDSTSEIGRMLERVKAKYLCCLFAVSASCRAVLRDNTAVVVELVNIVGTSSFRDIHVPAILVLSNLLQDVDSVQVPVTNSARVYF